MFYRQPLTFRFPYIKKIMSLNEFLFLFRRKTEARDKTITPEKLVSFNSRWNDWIKGLAITGQLSAQLKHWDLHGKILRSGNIVTPGPYLENDDYIESFIMVYAADYQEAREIAESCPIFELDGSVEVRMAI